METENSQHPVYEVFSSLNHKNQPHWHYSSGMLKGLSLHILPAHPTPESGSAVPYHSVLSWMYYPVSPQASLSVYFLSSSDFLWFAALSYL